MTRAFVVVLASFVLAGCGGGTTGQLETTRNGTGSGRIYPFKSAIIEYAFDGRGNEGTKTVYIDQWGALQAEKVSMELFNDDAVHKWVIARGDTVYTIDFDRNEALKTTGVDRRAHGVDLEALARQLGGAEKARRHLQTQGIELLADETYEGYPCQVIVEKVGPLTKKRWVHRGVTLKTLEYFEKYVSTVGEEWVTEVRFDVPVDAKYFELPEGVKVVRAKTAGR
jgi:hypothetical protein